MFGWSCGEAGWEVVLECEYSVAFWASDVVLGKGVGCYSFLFNVFSFGAFCTGVQTVMAYEFETFGGDVLNKAGDEFFYGKGERVGFLFVADDGNVLTVVVDYSSV